MSTFEEGLEYNENKSLIIFVLVGIKVGIVWNINFITLCAIPRILKNKLKICYLSGDENRWYKEFQRIENLEEKN